MKHTLRPRTRTLLRPLFASLCASLLGFTAQAQTPCPNPGYTYTVGCNLDARQNVNLDPGETLFIPAGVTYRGRINLNGNNSGNTVYNYGIWDSGDNLNLPGGATVYNYQGATAYFQSVNLNGGTSRLYNLGSLTVTNRLTSGGLINNAVSSTITAPEVTINSGGTLENLGTLNTSNIINNSNISNCGTIRQAVRNGGFTNNGGGVVSNFGRLDIQGDFTNNGEFQGATVGGVGVVRVVGDSRQNASGRFAVIGRLDFCDISNPTGRFDSGNGAFGPTTSTGPGLAPQLTYCQYTLTSAQIAGCAPNTPLPVELTSFNAKLNKGTVLLTWTTASEKNNDKFVVERSANGEAFEALTEVDGHGTSASAHSYSATDKAPLAGTSYYRLRQVDLDGTTSYSPVASIQNASASQANELHIYPNPAADQITLELPKAIEGTCEVRISTVSGKLVRRFTLNSSAPQVDIHSLPAGSYILQVQSAATQTVQRFVKQ